MLQNHYPECSGRILWQHGALFNMLIRSHAVLSCQVLWQAYIYFKVFRNYVFMFSRAFRIENLSTFDITTPARDTHPGPIVMLPKNYSLNFKSPFLVSASGPFRMVIINAPKVFSIAWTFVKPQLDEKTVAKISIFGSDQREALHGRKDEKSRSARKKSRAKMRQRLKKDSLVSLMTSFLRQRDDTL